MAASDAEAVAPGVDDPYALELGERLRRVRQQQHLSLHDVEARSDGDLKASVLGAYERGERAVSISRLHAMAQFFRVPVTELLPEPRIAPSEASDTEPALGEREQVVIDLSALDRHRHGEELLARYTDAIKSRRGDYNGRVLTVRGADLDTLAAVMGTSRQALRTRLAAAGIVR